MKKGLIFNIQRYSISDGPGIRTTVFLKGCPLRCWWCHNPESQSFDVQLLIRDNLCIRCGKCTLICDCPQLCIQCGKCAEACPSEARKLVGEYKTPSELLTEILRDQMFYEESGGGVTFSGGEPLSQPEFLFEALQLCKARGISTAVDTSGYASLDVIKKIAKNTDLWLYDIKHIDTNMHMQLTGVGNELILENLEFLVNNKAVIKIRIPIIPTCNDDIHTVKEIGQYLSSLAGIRDVHILPYHKLAEDKHHRFSVDYKLSNLRASTEDAINIIKNNLEYYGLKIYIGG